MTDRTPDETRAFAEPNVSAFYDTVTREEQQEVLSALRRVVNMNARPAAKLRQVHLIADKAFRHAEGRAACVRGCSHCCHIAVPLTTVEAQSIGERIGVAPRSVGHVQPRDPKSFSNKTPCPFLEDDECSIYEHRPLEWAIYDNSTRPPKLIGSGP